MNQFSFHLPFGMRVISITTDKSHIIVLFAATLRKKNEIINISMNHAEICTWIVFIKVSCLTHNNSSNSKKKYIMYFFDKSHPSQRECDCGSHKCNKWVLPLNYVGVNRPVVSLKGCVRKSRNFFRLAKPYEFCHKSSRIFHGLNLKTSLPNLNVKFE